MIGYSDGLGLVLLREDNYLPFLFFQLWDMRLCFMAEYGAGLGFIVLFF
jgi:hypothetical protein